MECAQLQKCNMEDRVSWQTETRICLDDSADGLMERLKLLSVFRCLSEFVVIVDCSPRIYERSTEEKIAAAERFRQEGNEAYRFLARYKRGAGRGQCTMSWEGCK